MMKKMLKIFLVVLMIFGGAIAISNMLETDMHAGAGWVFYHKDIPDCYGPGTSCFDMSGSKD